MREDINSMEREKERGRKKQKGTPDSFPLVALVLLVIFSCTDKQFGHICNQKVTILSPAKAS